MNRCVALWHAKYSQGREIASVMVMLRRLKKEKIRSRMNPGDPESEYCSPGSIEQQLDMCEEGELRGEQVERRTQLKEVPTEPFTEDPLEVTEELETFDITMAERDREGNEWSGDDHSAGLQGDEIQNQQKNDSNRDYLETSDEELI